MQSKLKEDRRDAEKIKRRMDSTFPDRRQAIVVKGLPLTAIKEMYPLLFSEREVGAAVCYHHRYRAGDTKEMPPS